MQGKGFAKGLSRQITGGIFPLPVSPCIQSAKHTPSFLNATVMPGPDSESIESNRKTPNDFNGLCIRPTLRCGCSFQSILSYGVMAQFSP